MLRRKIQTTDVVFNTEDLLSAILTFLPASDALCRFASTNKINYANVKGLSYSVSKDRLLCRHMYFSHAKNTMTHLLNELREISRVPVPEIKMTISSTGYIEPDEQKMSTLIDQYRAGSEWWKCWRRCGTTPDQARKENVVIILFFLSIILFIMALCSEESDKPLIFCLSFFSCIPMVKLCYFDFQVEEEFEQLEITALHSYGTFRNPRFQSLMEETKLEMPQAEM